MLSHSLTTTTFVDAQSTSTATYSPLPTAGFTIRGLMVLIAIAACLLAMPTLISVGILLASPLVAPFLARRMVGRRATEAGSLWLRRIRGRN